jgi:CheY-like chemotaxis protein
MSLAAANALEFPVSDAATPDVIKAEHCELENTLRDAHPLECLGDGAAGIAHQLRNILTPILGYVELATSMLPADSPVRPMLHEIGDAAERAADLVPQLIAYSNRGPSAAVLFPPDQRFDGNQPGEERSVLGKCVLIVDDDERILTLAQILLQSYGMKVRAAATGADALAIAAEIDHPLDVAVLDWMMPGTDGAVVARQLRMLRPGLPIVLSSGCGDDELTKSIDVPPNIHWIAKPYSAGELRKVLQRAIGGELPERDGRQS